MAEVHGVNPYAFTCFKDEVIVMRRGLRTIELPIGALERKMDALLQPALKRGLNQRNEIYNFVLAELKQSIGNKKSPLSKLNIILKSKPNLIEKVADSMTRYIHEFVMACGGAQKSVNLQQLIARGASNEEIARAISKPAGKVIKTDPARAKFYLEEIKKTLTSFWRVPAKVRTAGVNIKAAQAAIKITQQQTLERKGVLWNIWRGVKKTGKKVVNFVIKVFK